MSESLEELQLRNFLSWGKDDLFVQNEKKLFAILWKDFQKTTDDQKSNIFLALNLINDNWLEKSIETINGWKSQIWDFFMSFDKNKKSELISLLDTINALDRKSKNILFELQKLSNIKWILIRLLSGENNKNNKNDENYENVKYSFLWLYKKDEDWKFLLNKELVEEKIQERFLPFHLPVLEKVFLSKFELENQENLEINKKTLLNKYLYIIWIFGEKITPSQLYSLLTNDKTLSERRDFFDKVNENMSKIPNGRKKVFRIQLYKQVLGWNLDLNTNDLDSIINKAKDWLFGHIWDSIKVLMDIFKDYFMWFELKNEELADIIYEIKHLFGNLDVLIKNNFFDEDKKTQIIKKSSVAKVSKDNNKLDETRTSFVSYLWEFDWNKILWDQNKNQEIQDKNQEIQDKIKELKNKYFDLEKKEQINLDNVKNIDLENITSAQISKLYMDDKMLYFFPKIFDYRWALKISELWISDVDFDKNDGVFNFVVDKFFDKQYKYRYKADKPDTEESDLKKKFREEIKADLKNIKLFEDWESQDADQKESKVKKFIKDRTNDAFLIVELFEEHLFRKENKNKTDQETKELRKNFKPTTAVQEIANRIENIENIDNTKLDIFTDTRVGNTSTENISAKLAKYRFGSSRWHINSLEDPKFEVTKKDNSKTYLKNIKSLYIPPLDWSMSIKDRLDDFTNYLKWKKTKSDQKFQSVLEESNIEQTDENLIKVRDFLKYVRFLLVWDPKKSKEENLTSMLSRWSQDRKLMKEIFLNIDEKTLKSQENMNDEEEKTQISNYIKENIDSIKSIFGNFSMDDNGKPLIHIWPNKSEQRALEKVVWWYDWNLSQLTDLTRMSIDYDRPKDCFDGVAKFVQFAQKNDQIKQISMVDNTGNIVQKANKWTWYRDIKLLVKLENGNTIEVQFQYKQMSKMKKEWIPRNDEYLKDKIKKYKIKFRKDEIPKILELFEKESKKYPHPKLPDAKTFKEMFLQDEEAKTEFDSIIKKNPKYIEIFLEQNQKISTDWFYHISRNIEKSSYDMEKWLYQKLAKLESILFEKAWWEALYSEMDKE